MRSKREKILLLMPAISLQILNTTTLVKSVKQTKMHFLKCISWFEDNHNFSLKIMYSGLSMYAHIFIFVVWIILCTSSIFCNFTYYFIMNIYSFLSKKMYFNEHIILLCGVRIINSWFSKLEEANYIESEMAI